MGSNLIKLILDNYSFYEIVDLLHTQEPVFIGQSYSNLGLFFLQCIKNNLVKIKYFAKNPAMLSTLKGIQMFINNLILKPNNKNILVLSLSDKLVSELISTSFHETTYLTDIPTPNL